MKSVRMVLALLLGLCAGAHAQWNAAALGSFGIATLTDPAVSAKLAARFRTRGEPVFLIGNVSFGLQQGDLMRFPDRAVLIDGDVWQTLRSEGALAALKVAPVVRVKARAGKESWASRARAVQGQERKAYELGERLLRSMEGAMPSMPDGQKLSISFEAGQMVLMVPPGFLERFRLPRGAGDDGRPAPPSPRESPRGIPRIAFSVPGQVFLGVRLDLRAWAVDDSGGPGSDLRLWCEGTPPPGVSWNATTRALEGVPSSEGSFPLTLRSSGPGGSDSLSFSLSVRRDRAPFFRGVPDTARPGAAWRFSPAPGDSDHSLSELRVAPLELPRGARWDSASACVLWTPTDSDLVRPGTVRLRATDPLGESTDGAWTVPVARERPWLAPVFLSEPGGGTPRAGDRLSYKPVAVSPQGGELRLRAVLPMGSPVSWDGQRLWLQASRPGSYEAELLAEDSRGSLARQRIAWDVRASHRTSVFVETRHEAGLEPWQAGVDFGTGRIGLFTPSMGRLTGWKDMKDQELPYLFLGANLLDEQARSRGNTMTADLGFTVRIPKTDLYTGGFFGRLSGRLRSLGPLPLETDFGVLGWIRQAVMVTDSNVLTTITLSPSQQNQFKVNDSRWTVSKMLTVRDRYWSSVQKILDDSQADDNIVLFSELWGWVPVGAGLKAGFGVWRVDLPMASISHQSLGCGLEGGWDLGRFRAEPSIRGGWGPAGAGFSAWGGLLVSLDVSRGSRR